MQVFEKQKKLNINFKTKPTAEPADISLTQQDDKAVISLNGIDFEGSGLPEATEAGKVLGTIQEQIEGKAAIPNSGHVGTIHIDTTKSKEEVIALLAELEYRDVPDLGAQYGVVATADMAAGLTCFRIDAGDHYVYGITLQLNGEEAVNLFLSNYEDGWKEEATDTIELNIDAASVIPVIDLPIGQLNEQLKDLFYIEEVVPGEVKAEWIPKNTVVGHTLNIRAIKPDTGKSQYTGTMYIVKAGGDVITLEDASTAVGQTFTDVVEVLTSNWAMDLDMFAGTIIATSVDGNYGRWFWYSAEDNGEFYSRFSLVSDCAVAFGTIME